MSGGTELVTQFIDKKREEISLQKDSLASVAKLNPAKSLSDNLHKSVTDSIMDSLEGSPLLKLGKDFLSEQLSKNGSKIINNIEATALNKFNKVIAKTIAPVEQIQNMIFDSITSILTAQNDLAMFFIQKLSKQCIIALDNKIKINNELKLRVQELHNIITQIVEGSPFFNTYLAQLRKGLSYIYEARNDVVIVRNTLQVNDKWLKVRYKGAKEKLILAEELLQPAKTGNKDGSYVQHGLLSGVGIPSKPQQVELLLALPQKIKEVLACANGYFFATLRANALLLAFIQAQGAFQNASSRKLKQFTINTLDNIVTRLDDLITQMATQLNGSPSAILAPDTVETFIPSPELIAAAQNGENINVTDPTTFKVKSTKSSYKPDSLKTSAAALGWLIELKMIVGYFEIIPGPTLEALDVSNAALAKYEKAVKFIKSKGNVSSGTAFLTATEGREETGELESQLTTYILTAGKALVDAKTGKKAISLGKTIIVRLELSIEQDTEIRTVLNEFATANLSFSAAQKRAGNSIFSMLDKYGMDRAADFLRNGLFKDFFNMDGKTATYAGAALTALATIKECLTTSEDRQQITQAQREIEREQKSKELLTQRASASGYQARITSLDKKEANLETLNQRTQIAGKKCGLSDDMSPTNLLKSLGPIVGVGLLGNSTIQAKLGKYSKGIL